MTTSTNAFFFGTKPYKHQEELFARTKNARIFAIFWEMGTGKSKVIIDTAAYLYLIQEINGLLIATDKGAYLNWVYSEVPKHMPNNVPYRLAYWSCVLRRDARKALNEIMLPRARKLDILCMNVEALSTERATKAAEEFLENHRAMMVVDESTSIKNIKAARTKAAIALGQLAKYRRIMSGAPITQSPLDIYSQFEFLGRGLLGHSSWTGFKNYYGIWKQVIMGTRTFQKVVGYRNLTELTNRVMQFASRVRKVECLDLPDKIYQIEHVEMTPDQRDAYKKFRNEALLLLRQGQLTSTCALTTIEKLHQICCGHVRLDNGATINIPNYRIPRLMDMLDEIDGKAIIWAHYQRDIENILAAIKEKYGQSKFFAVAYYGKTPEIERIFALDKFTNDPNCRWFVGSPGSGGKGLTLISAAHVIYFSNSYRLEHRLQSEDRAHRIGQTKNVCYIDLLVPNTIDSQILTALKEKRDLARQVIDPVAVGELIRDEVD